jgi:hypothetical protein
MGIALGFTATSAKVGRILVIVLEVAIFIVGPVITYLF